jgi:hypothetical protein
MTIENIQFTNAIKHKKFPSIDHFRVFLKELRRYYNYRSIPDENIPKNFVLEGTVKLHGTHADLVFTKETNNHKWKMSCQSRNRVLSLEQDNCGFANFIHNIPSDIMQQFVQKILTIHNENNPNTQVVELMVAGEFCGESIQKKVALTSLPKMFVIFDIKINGFRQDYSIYKTVELPQYSIYNISRAGLFTATLTFNDTESVVPLLQEMTKAVEEECPFAKTFGVSGTGEGIVWKCRVPKQLLNTETKTINNDFTQDNNNTYIEDSRFWFKVKGKEHAVSNVKTLKSREGNSINIKNTNDFVTRAVLPARLEQGLDYLREMNLTIDMKNLGTYLKWVIQDVLKEDGDAIVHLGLDAGLVKKTISSKAKAFFFKIIKNT